MDKVLLVRYAEIHLKGLNRPFFERLLVDRIKQALNPVHAAVEREQGRIFVYGIPEENIPECTDKLCRVFGIHSVSPAWEMDKDFDMIAEKLAANTPRKKKVKGG